MFTPVRNSLCHFIMVNQVLNITWTSLFKTVIDGPKVVIFGWLSGPPGVSSQDWESDLWSYDHGLYASQFGPAMLGPQFAGDEKAFKFVGEARPAITRLDADCPRLPYCLTHY